MFGVVAAVIVPLRGDLAAEANLHRILIAGNQPALGRGAPVVGHLGLLAVLELLLENAQLVADGVAGALQAQCRHAVHIAGSQTPEAAVAEAGVGLFFKNVHSAAAHVLQGAHKRFADAQVEGVLHQAASHQELHRHIVNFLLGTPGILGRQETAHDLADHHGCGAEDLLFGSGGAGRGKIGTELVFNGAAHLVAGNLSNHMGKYLQ